MRTLIWTTLLAGAVGLFFALQAPASNSATTTALASTATVAELRLIDRLRDMASPPTDQPRLVLSAPAATAAAAPAPVAPATPAPEEREVAAAGVEELVVTPEALNVRAEPSSHGAVLGRLLQGETVEVGGREHGWVHVASTDGIVGWAYSDFLAPSH